MSRTSRASGLFIAVVVAASTALVVACGARGPLDADAPLDAGGQDVETVDAADAAPPPPDATPADAAKEGGSIIGCGTCLVGQCGAGIIACVQDTKCRQTFQCVVTQCLAGGGAPSPACLFTCASGDIQGALKIFQIFQCVTGKCGVDCNPLLEGLLGGLGGGGGGGGGGSSSSGGPPKDGGNFAGERPVPPFAKALSHWPDLYSPSAPISSP